MTEQSTLSRSFESWAFKPRSASGDPKDYAPKCGDVVYSCHSVYRSKWAEALTRDQPLRIVQVREVYGLKVKFIICETSKGKIVQLGEYALSESDFLTFLEHGQLPGAR